MSYLFWPTERTYCHRSGDRPRCGLTAMRPCGDALGGDGRTGGCAAMGRRLAQSAGAAACGDDALSRLG